MVQGPLLFFPFREAVSQYGLGKIGTVENSAPEASPLSKFHVFKPFPPPAERTLWEYETAGTLYNAGLSEQESFASAYDQRTGWLDPHSIRHQFSGREEDVNSVMAYALQGLWLTNRIPEMHYRFQLRLDAIISRANWLLELPTRRRQDNRLPPQITELRQRMLRDPSTADGTGRPQLDPLQVALVVTALHSVNGLTTIPEPSRLRSLLQAEVARCDSDGGEVYKTYVMIHGLGLLDSHPVKGGVDWARLQRDSGLTLKSVAIDALNVRPELDLSQLEKAAYALGSLSLMGGIPSSLLSRLRRFAKKYLGNKVISPKLSHHSGPILLAEKEVFAKGSGAEWAEHSDSLPLLYWMMLAKIAGAPPISLKGLAWAAAGKNPDRNYLRLFTLPFLLSSQPSVARYFNGPYFVHSGRAGLRIKAWNLGAHPIYRVRYRMDWRAPLYSAESSNWEPVGEDFIPFGTEGRSNVLKKLESGESGDLEVKFNLSRKARGVANVAPFSILFEDSAGEQFAETAWLTEGDYYGKQVWLLPPSKSLAASVDAILDGQTGIEDLTDAVADRILAHSNIRPGRRVDVVSLLDSLDRTLPGQTFYSFMTHYSEQIRGLKARFETFADAPTELQVISWLKQFGTNRARQLMLKLAQAITYYPMSKVREMLHELYQELPENYSRVFLSFLGPLDKGERSLAKEFVTANKSLSRPGGGTMIDFRELRELLDIVSKMSASERRSTAVVFLSDIAGSGRQIVRFYRALDPRRSQVETLPEVSPLSEDQFQLLTKLDRYFYCLLADSTGVHNILDSHCFSGVCAAVQLDDSDKAFSERRGIFDTEAELIEARDIAFRFGRRLVKRKQGVKESDGMGPFGWCQGELLVAFSYNVPNNSLPILWATKTASGQPWTPLLARSN